MQRAMKTARVLLSGVALSLVLAACQEQTAPTPPPPKPASPPPASPTAQVPVPAAGNDPAKAEAADVFKSRCLPCHGATGAGDGPASSVLTPKPRDLRDPEWQKSV